MFPSYWHLIWGGQNEDKTVYDHSSEITHRILFERLNVCLKVYVAKCFEFFSVLCIKEFFGRLMMFYMSRRWEWYTSPFHTIGYIYFLDYLSPFLIIKLPILHSWCCIPYYFMRHLESTIPKIVDGARLSGFLLEQYLLSLSVF